LGVRSLAHIDWALYSRGPAGVAWRGGDAVYHRMLMTIRRRVCDFVNGEPKEAALVVFLFAVAELLKVSSAGRHVTAIRALTKLCRQRRGLEKWTVRPREVAAETAPASGRSCRCAPVTRVPCDGSGQRHFAASDEAPFTGKAWAATSKSRTRELFARIGTPITNTTSACSYQSRRRQHHRPNCAAGREAEKAPARPNRKRFMRTGSAHRNHICPPWWALAVLVAVRGSRLLRRRVDEMGPNRALALLLTLPLCTGDFRASRRSPRPCPPGRANGLLQLKGGAVIESGPASGHAYVAI